MSILGLLGSLLGLFFSYRLDLPTGAAIVCTFGILLILSVLWRRYGDVALQQFLDKDRSNER